MIFGTSLAIITSVFQPGERGRAMGINITAVYLGLVMWSGNRRISYTVFWMEKYFCISGSFWHYITYSYKQKNKNRMGRMLPVKNLTGVDLLFMELHLLHLCMDFRGFLPLRMDLYCNRCRDGSCFSAF